MDSSLAILLTTAVTIGVVHTILGPDHYLPFIALAKARNWTISKALWITFVCGIAHVASSVVIGLFGIAAGLAVTHLEAFESLRGDIAGWLLLVFGAGYLVWGIYKSIKGDAHRHVDPTSGAILTHSHGQDTEKSTASPDNNLATMSVESVNGHKKSWRELTPWLLFVVFIFGPCEPLIPILMYPALQHNFYAVIVTALIFAVATIGTMLVLTATALLGLKQINLSNLSRYGHAAAGFVVLLCGVAIKLGL